MKTLFSIILSCVALFAFSQDVDTTLTRADYKEYKTSLGGTTVTYHFVTDTIDAESDDDTTRIVLPHIFSTAIAGVIQVAVDTFVTDTIPGGSILVGTYELKEAQCLSGCPDEPTDGAGTIPVNVGIDNDDSAPFYIRNTRAWIEIITESGRGVISIWITLKPSSITN